MGAQCARHTGHARSAKGLRKLSEAEIASRCAEANVALALTRNLRILRCLAAQSQCVEREGGGK
jgi:hypothetical protein